MKDLISLNACSSSDIAANAANKAESLRQSCPPDLPEDELKACQAQLGDLKDGNAEDLLSTAVYTNPWSPEVFENFVAYTLETTDTLIENDFASFREGCGSAPELLWHVNAVCPCDSVKVANVINGETVEDRASYLLPAGRVTIFNTLETDIIVNGRTVRKSLSAWDQKVAANSLRPARDRTNLGGTSLNANAFFIDDNYKQEFLYTSTV